MIHLIGILSTIAVSVPAGATKPNHAVTSMSLIPASAMVGTSAAEANVLHL
jgi:hypothetical protein